MPLRKHVIQNECDVPSETRHVSENTQESEADGDTDQEDNFSLSLLLPPSTRQNRRRERETKSKPKEMTEEEMMDLALRLSKQEASDTALRLQQEEEAMMEAIHQSMFDQTQPCPPSQSQSLLTDPDASVRSCSRRKALFSNGKRVSSVSQGASEDVCAPERVSEELPVTCDVKVLGVKESRGENKCRNKKRKRKEGSPLLDRCTSDSPGGSVLPDSPQSSDSTQIDDCQLRKSPVFPSSACRAVVHIPPLSQDLLETCRMSGFVSFSQDSRTSPHKSLPLQPKSPTCPRSPSNLRTCPKSPVFSETEQGDHKEMEPSPEYLKSPVFGRNTQRQTSSCASKRHIGVCEQSHETSGVTFSSQESFTSSSRVLSCRPKSPVFPSSPCFPRNHCPPERPKSSETYRGPAETRSDNIMQKTCVVPSAAEIGSSNSDMTSAMENPPPSLRTHSNSQDVRLIAVGTSPPPDAAQELKSDMTLLWSDEDEDVTPAGSASPVFPEERPVCRADVHVDPLNHATTGLVNSSICQQRQQPVSCQGSGSRPLEGGSTVHYYWGVPFCPRGLDPDTYTQVILAQMDVYDQSLRQAQRLLLKKAPWGDPILPQPEKCPSPESPAEHPQDSPPLHAPRRLGLKLRHKRAAEDPPSEEGEVEEEVEVEVEVEVEEKNEDGAGEETQVDTDDCEVCPETQLSDDNDNTPELMMASDARDEPGSPDPPEVEMILRDGSPAVAEPQEEEMEEMEVDVGGKTEASATISSCDMREEVMEDGVEPHVEEISVEGLQRSTSPELELAADAQQSSTTSVNCPICQGSFPLTKIELHAAYCEGEVAVVEERRSNSLQVSVKSRRKRAWRAEATEDTNSSSSSSSSRNQEKCYICQRSVPLRDYSRHTELCIQRQPSNSDTALQRGNLLSALEQTETRPSEARTSGSRLQLREVIDLRDDDDDVESAVSPFQISNSPIRSFTPISEATDCLVDFRRQQRVKKPSHRWR